MPQRTSTYATGDTPVARAWPSPPSANAMEVDEDGVWVVRSRSARRAAWVLVAGILVGCNVVAVGIVLGQWPVAVLGAAAVLIAGVLAFVLPRAGKCAPISMGVQYPPHTVGPRGDDGTHTTPIDTHPNGGAD